MEPGLWRLWQCHAIVCCVPMLECFARQQAGRFAVAP